MLAEGGMPEVWNNVLTLGLQQGPVTLILGLVCCYLYRMLQQERAERVSNQKDYAEAFDKISENMAQNNKVHKAIQDTQESIVRFVIGNP